MHVQGKPISTRFANDLDRGPHFIDVIMAILTYLNTKHSGYNIRNKQDLISTQHNNIPYTTELWVHHVSRCVSNYACGPSVTVKTTTKWQRNNKKTSDSLSWNYNSRKFVTKHFMFVQVQHGRTSDQVSLLSTVHVCLVNACNCMHDAWMMAMHCEWLHRFWDFPINALSTTCHMHVNIQDDYDMKLGPLWLHPR